MPTAGAGGARSAVAALCMALAACGGERGEDFTAARSPDGPGFGWRRRPSLESSLQAGMPYARFRQELLSRGWQPLPDPHCRANLVGVDSGETCSSAPDLCGVCEALPELSLYAPDGMALVWFRHPDGGHELSASVVGDIGDRDRQDAGSRFRIVEWEIADGH